MLVRRKDACHRSVCVFGFSECNTLYVSSVAVKSQRPQQSGHEVHSMTAQYF